MTLQDLLAKCQECTTALNDAEAAAASYRQASSDADTAVVQAKSNASAAVVAVKDGLAKAGPTFIVGADGKPRVEDDGTVRIFETSEDGWRVTVAKPSTLPIPE